MTDLTKDSPTPRQRVAIVLIGAALALLFAFAAFGAMIVARIALENPDGKLPNVSDSRK